MTLVLILFFIFLLTGMPVAFAIGIAGFAFSAGVVLASPCRYSLSFLKRRPLPCWRFPCLFAGNLMNETGITKGCWNSPN